MENLNLLLEINKIRNKKIDVFPKVKKYIKYSPDIPSTVYILLYLKHIKNIQLSEKENKYIQKYIQQIQKNKNNKKEIKNKKENKYQKIKSGIYNKISEKGILNEIEKCIDYIFKHKKCNYDFFEKNLKKYNLNTKYIQIIIEYIEKNYNELKNIEYDEYLKESYSYLSKKDIKKIIHEIENFKNFLKNISKTNRKQRKINISKKVKKLQYLKYYNNINSINPIKIWNANELWTYNVEKNILRVFISSEGLLVKGTTLYNFDNNSYEIKIRKNKIDLFFNILKENKKRKIKSFLKEQKRKEIKTGRISKKDLLIYVN